MPRHSVAGTTVAISGGAQGIGAEMARVFAARGARVAIGDINADLARATAKAIGGSCVAEHLDVTDQLSFVKFLSAAEDRLGPLDVLINNAGVLELAPFAEQSAESIRRHIDVNIVGTLWGTQAAINLMAPRRSGHVVNFASIAGVVPIPSAAAYTATKHAVVGFTDTLRIEMRGSGLRFTTVLPTHVRTPMTHGIAENRFLPVADPEDVAAAVLSAVETGKREVFVPRAMAVLRPGRALLPIPVVGLATTLVGGDSQLSAAAQSAKSTQGETR